MYKGTDSKPWRKASELGMVGLLGANFLRDNFPDYVFCVSRQ